MALTGHAHALRHTAWKGSDGNYLSKTGSGSYRSTYVDQQHNREYARLAKERKQEKLRRKWYNQNPPCGIYGRVPTRCKYMEPRF
ncbi:MAG: hypothetical protein OXQ96_04045 [Alphaproteobacteria bacterium]|nr:hypothetical protein [Alphaproteobacteria bacterium]